MESSETIIKKKIAAWRYRRRWRENWSEGAREGIASGLVVACPWPARGRVNDRTPSLQFSCSIRKTNCSMFRGIALHFAPYAQQVAAPDLGDIGVAETRAAQRGGDIARLRRIHPAGDAAAPVEIGSNADVVDAGDFRDVFDVRDQIVDRGERIL